MIGFAPVLRSVTVVAAPGAVTCSRTGATCRDAAEAQLLANELKSKRVRHVVEYGKTEAFQNVTVTVIVSV